MNKFAALLLALVLILTFSACGNGNNKNSENDSASIMENKPEQDNQNTADKSSDDTSKNTQEPPAPFTNPLTGEGVYTDIAANRPYAIMLNTIKQAMPQSGNSQADIYYELVEEGGITRIMGIYQDITDVGVIGTIRSTRPYYVQLAVGLDGLLVHAGGSHEGLNEISNLNLKTINALGAAGGIFYRSQDRLSRGVALEHTMYVNSDSMQEWLANSNYRTAHEDGYAETHIHKFVEDGTPSGGDTASVVTVPFSGYKKTEFTYDESTRKYLVDMYYNNNLTEYIDEQTSGKISVTNVIVISTKIYTQSNERMNIAITGSGNGYYACGGKIIPITWEKDSYSDLYTLTTENGDELSLGVGKTYVCIIGTGDKIIVQ